MVGSVFRFVDCGQKVGSDSRFVGCGQLCAKGFMERLRISSWENSVSSWETSVTQVWAIGCQGFYGAADSLFVGELCLVLGEICHSVMGNWVPKVLWSG